MVSILVAFIAGICDDRLVSICFKFIVCIPNGWGPPTGNWMTYRWSPAPGQT